MFSNWNRSNAGNNFRERTNVLDRERYEYFIEFLDTFEEHFADDIGTFEKLYLAEDLSNGYIVWGGGSCDLYQRFHYVQSYHTHEMKIVLDCTYSTLEPLSSPPLP